jgi:hypothetical protein
MEALQQKLNPSGQDAIVLCFALAKIHDDLGNYERAFKLFCEGNRHHARNKTDTIEDARDSAAMVREIFSNLNLSSFTPAQSEARQRPVFILGMPRSGTSLVEQILATHSEVYGGGELGLMGQWCFGYLKLARTHGKNLQLQNYIGQLRSHYLSGIGKLSDKPVVTDKMPVNFFWLGFLLLALPEAVVIHTSRDPMATCWSNFKTPFAGRSNGFACDLEHIGEFYSLYRELMSFWETLFPNRIYTLHYEELTRHQERESRNLLQHAGLEWEEQCLDFHLNPRQVRTASQYQVSQPIYQGSSESWKPYEAFLQPLRKYLAKTPA